MNNKIDYEKLWEEIEQIGKELTIRPPEYAKSERGLMEEIGLTRGETRKFIGKMIKNKKLELWGKYKNVNYYVPIEVA